MGIQLSIHRWSTAFIRVIQPLSAASYTQSLFYSFFGCKVINVSKHFPSLQVSKSTNVIEVYRFIVQYSKSYISYIFCGS